MTSIATTPTAPNVDQAELDKFQSIASRWWDPTSEFKPLHDINPLRLGWITEQAGGSLQDQVIVDVGCGGGILSESMARAGADVLGIDLADQSLAVAQMHALDGSVPVRYEQVAVETLAQREPESRDIVTCMEMLEHVPDPAQIIAACARLAKPGGLVFFSTISRNPKAFALAIIGAEYLLRMIPRGTHDYERLIKPSELVAAARRHALEPIALCGLRYNPVTRIYSLHPTDVDVNYMVALRKA
jgi:2-polyprenyl-6-hydroxyphenyl methylase/3-demethylubiquinone-9 3-methyltransferase